MNNKAFKEALFDYYLARSKEDMYYRIWNNIRETLKEEIKNRGIDKGVEQVLYDYYTNDELEQLVNKHLNKNDKSK